MYNSAALIRNLARISRVPQRTENGSLALPPAAVLSAALRAGEGWGPGAGQGAEQVPRHPAVQLVLHRAPPRVGMTLGSHSHFFGRPAVAMASKVLGNATGRTLGERGSSSGGCFTVAYSGN